MPLNGDTSDKYRWPRAREGRPNTGRSTVEVREKKCQYKQDGWELRNFSRGSNRQPFWMWSDCAWNRSGYSCFSSLLFFFYCYLHLFCFRVSALRPFLLLLCVNIRLNTKRGGQSFQQAELIADGLWCQWPAEVPGDCVPVSFSKQPISWSRMVSWRTHNAKLMLTNRYKNIATENKRSHSTAGLRKLLEEFKNKRFYTLIQKKKQVWNKVIIFNDSLNYLDCIYIIFGYLFLSTPGC